MVVDHAWVDAIRARLVELPDVKIARYVTALGLDPRDAHVLAADRRVAEYFEAVVAASSARGSATKVVAAEPKTVANWITGELFRLMNAAGAGIEAVKITPAALAELLALVAAGQI